MAGHGVEQGGRILAGEDHPAVGGMKEALGGGAVAEGEKRVEVAFHVEQGHRLPVEAELRPGEGLKELVECAEAAGQSEEGVSEFVHEGLAVVHGFDDVQMGEATVSDLPVDERLRDDTDGLAARGESGIGQSAHQAHGGSTADEAQTPARNFGAREARGHKINFADTGAGSAENTNRPHSVVRVSHRGGGAGGL